MIAGLTGTVILACLAIVLLGWQGDLDAGIRWHILTQLQLPLLLNAILVGATLTISAGTLQVVLRNPLADPGIIGITSGASLIAAGLILFLPEASVSYFHYILPLGGFAGALLSTFVIYRVARHLGGASTTVILAGIALSTLSGAAVAWMYLFADAQSMRNLTFWLMGNLYQADQWVLIVSGPVMLLSLIYQISQSRNLNRLYAGDMAAAAAGVNVATLSRRCLVAAALGVGACVATAGSIAFIGLLVPHFVRLSFGFDHRMVLPVSGLAGALILLLVVLLTEATRLITLPVSMVTATIGGPLLLIALYKGQWR